MESEDALLELLSQAVARKHVVEAIFVSTLMVLIYDWLLILPQEVKYIWCASWNYTKVLYLVARYAPFISVSLMIRNQLAFGPSPGSCKMALEAACWIAFAGVDVTEVILAVRTYAVWNKDKRVGIGLALLLVLLQVPNGIIAERFLNGIDFIHDPYPEVFRGCVALSAPKIFFVNWVLFSFMEGVVLALMVISALRTYRKNTSNFMNVIYLEGIRFYVYMLCVTLANVLTTLLLPINFIAVGSMLEIVLHSNLACRLVVGLREASKSPGSKSGAFELSEISNDDTVVFAHPNRRVVSSESARIDPEAHAGPSNP